MSTSIPFYVATFTTIDESEIDVYQFYHENGKVGFKYAENHKNITDKNKYEVIIDKYGKYCFCDQESGNFYYQKNLIQNDNDDNTIASIQNDDSTTHTTKDSSNESQSTAPLTWKDRVLTSTPNSTKKMVDKILSNKKYPNKKSVKNNLELSTVNPSDNVQFLSFSLNKKSEDEKNNCLDELKNHIKNISEKKLKNIKDGKEIFYLNTITNEFAHKLQQGNWIFFKFQYIIDELNIMINDLFSGELKISAKNSDPKGSDKKIFVELYLHNKNELIR